MDKTIKILIIVVLSLLGLAILVGGAVFIGSQFGRGVSHVVQGTLEEIPGGALPESGEDLQLGEFSQDFGDSVKALDIRVEAGDYKIVEGEQFSVTGEDVNTGSFTCRLEGDTLVVRESWEGRFLDSFRALFRKMGYYPKVTVTVPAGAQLRDVELQIYAGKLNACDLTTDGFSLDMAAGELEAGTIQAGELEIDLSAGGAVFEALSASSAHVEVSAGGVEIREMDSDWLELETSAGSLEVQALHFGNLEADCSAGSIRIETLEKESDCRMEMDVSAGSVRVNGTDYKGDTVLGTQDAPHRMELDVSAGQIQVDFR